MQAFTTAYPYYWLKSSPGSRDALYETASRWRFCSGLVLVAQFPVYGSGGHGPMRWFSLSELFSDINKSYGIGTVEIVYGAAMLLLCGMVLLRKFKKNHRKPVKKKIEKLERP